MNIICIIKLPLYDLPSVGDDPDGVADDDDDHDVDADPGQVNLALSQGLLNIETF